jgi:UDP-N-acetylglucosamine diphosphorylase/glucosamine-1-phosphate N-acetyltransferase
MQAIILAAGEGSRMRPLSYTRPKVMLPLAGRPIMEHLVIAAIAAGIKEFILVVGYYDHLIRDYFGDGSKWQVKIGYVTQKRQLGTADAIGKASERIRGDFLVLNGDVLVSLSDIQALIKASGNVMSVCHREECSGLGVIEVDGQRVTAIHEKCALPPSNLANAGLYRFTPEIMDLIETTEKSPRGEYEITDTLLALIGSGKTLNHHRIEYWLDVSYPWDLLGANETMLEDLKPVSEGTIEDGAVIKGPVSLGKGSVIRAGSYITGPVIIGEDCSIGPNCRIRSASTIGDGCNIGAFVEVKNSIVMRGTRIPHLNYVGDSVIGEDCNFGAGTKIANLRLDKRNVKVNGIDSGRRKLGAIIGDNVETGINASINVGTLIGNGCHIGPGAAVSGVLLPDARWY